MHYVLTQAHVSRCSRSLARRQNQYPACFARERSIAFRLTERSKIAGASFRSVMIGRRSMSSSLCSSRRHRLVLTRGRSPPRQPIVPACETENIAHSSPRIAYWSMWTQFSVIHAAEALHLSTFSYRKSAMIMDVN